MRVEFLIKFKQDVERTKQLLVKKAINRAIERMENAINLSGIQSCKKLTSFKNAYRVRVSSYRIGFYCMGDVIELAPVAHRKDIYKIFP